MYKVGLDTPYNSIITTGRYYGRQSIKTKNRAKIGQIWAKMGQY